VSIKEALEKKLVELRAASDNAWEDLKSDIEKFLK